MSITDDEFAELIAMWSSSNARAYKRSVRKSSTTEHDLQISCVQEFRLRNPRLRDLLVAIPNGGQRHIKVAAKLKAEGVVAGVPDLFFAYSSGQWHGLFVEMKNGKAEVVSEKQKHMMLLLSQYGYKCVVCHTRDEFFTALHEYMQGSNKLLESRKLAKD